jgi:hypothetical protein
MIQLGQNSQFADWRPYCPPVPKKPRGSSLGPSDLIGLAGLHESTRVRPRTTPEVVGGFTQAGGLTNFGARAHGLAFKETPRHVIPVSANDVSFHLGSSVSTKPQLEPSVNVSDPAESFARKHGLWGSLIVLKSLILGGEFPLLSINVALVSDAEISGHHAISFNIRTNAEPSDVLDFDERIRELAYDQLPMDDQIYFAIRFEFE